jgi:hydrogenase/urease accessory protein HupE
VLLATALAIALSSGVAEAHDDGVSSSRIDIGNHEIRQELDVGLAPLAQALGVSARDLRAAILETGALGERARAYLAGAAGATVAGQPLPARPGTLSVHEDGAGGGERVLYRAVLPSRDPVRSVDLRLSVFSELGSGHRALLQVVWGPHQRQFVRVGPAVIHLEADQMAPSRWAQLREFLPWGVHHILVGYDHLAFLLALLLAATSLRQMLVIVTAFTLAHSLTLVLSALGAVDVPARLVEALIAASVAYVAAENLGWWRAHARSRGPLTFVFGLVHGLGFATELRQRLAEVGGGWWLPVLSFNLGVELGQLAVIGLVFPVLVRLRGGRTRAEAELRHRRLVRMGSLPLFILGVFWLLMRIAD